MAKILRRLLLIIPILFLFPKIAFADTINYYNRDSSHSWESLGDYTYNTYSYDAFNNTFVNNYVFGRTSMQGFSFVVYNKVENIYSSTVIVPRNSTCYNSSSYDFLLDAHMHCSNYDDTNSIEPPMFFEHTAFITTNNDISSYIHSIYSENSDPTVSQNGYYYLNSVNASMFGKYLNYILNNFSDFEFIGVDKETTLLFNGVEMPLKSSIIEEDIPVYNFNNNKYYVPNYEKGNCVEVLDKDTIRVFNDEFTSFYTDYYINSNYISKTGQVEVDYEKHCSTLEFTDIRYYGNDFPQILFITLVATGFSVGLIYLLLKRFRKR